MSIVVYVSGHGLGHSTREIEVLRYLPQEIPLIVKTVASETFWRTELPRPFTCEAQSFDVGCVQKNGLEMDIPATLQAWREIQQRNTARFEQEGEYLRRTGARLVVTDVASFPLKVAAAVGIPSVCIANFTWSAIYRAFIAEEPAFADVADELDREYAAATLLLEAGFAVSMPAFPKTQSVGLIARSGHSRRDTLLDHLPETAHGKRLALVYVSGWGLPIDYKQVEQIPDWHFISLDAPPVITENWSVLPRFVMAHPDLVASVDAVISKPGYGIAGECVLAGTPLIYPPRLAFAEYHPMHRELMNWAGGINIPLDDFMSVNWKASLEAVPERGTISCWEAPGGPASARILTEMFFAKL